MKLRGVEYGPVLAGSGAMGFFGEGYWFHRLMRPFGFSLKGMTLVSKTTTLLPMKGNMTLNRRFGPLWPFPRCIKTGSAHMLNAVGLSGPGLETLLKTMKWQILEDPFGISVMSTASTPEKRLEEHRKIVGIFNAWMNSILPFDAPFFIQINASCPNTDEDPRTLIGEVAETLGFYSALDVPLMPKFSVASAPITVVMELNDNPHCDAICVSNTVPYDWEGLGEKVWGQKKSPLDHLGGGGISGAPIKEFVLNWIRELRAAGFTKPINGGGGIMTVRDIDAFHDAGVDSIFFASAAALSVRNFQPKLPQKLILRSQQLFGE